MTLTKVQVDGCPFDLCFSRMTMAEVMTGLIRNGYANTTLDVPSHLRGQGVLSDLEHRPRRAVGTLTGGVYHQGYLKNGLRAYEVYDLLAAEYAIDPGGFLTDMGISDPRAWELVNQTPRSRAETPLTTRLSCWPENPPVAVIDPSSLATGRMVKSCQVYYGKGGGGGGALPDVATVKAEVEANSKNGQYQRAIAFGGYQSFCAQALTFDAGSSWRYALWDGDWESTQLPPGIWLDKVIARKLNGAAGTGATESDWKYWWQQYHAAGGQVDQVQLTMEADQSHWKIITEADLDGSSLANTGKFTGGGNNIAADVRWDVFKANFPFSASDWSAIDTWPGATGDDRVFLLDADLRATYIDYLHGLAAIIKSYFPNARVDAYEGTIGCPGTYQSWKADGARFTKLSGGFGRAAAALEPTVSGLYSDWEQRWNWRGRSLGAPPNVNKPYEALICCLSTLRMAKAATTLPVTAWLADRQSTAQADSDYWKELVLHALLGADRVWWYHADPGNENDEVEVCRLVAEHDAVVGFEGKEVRPGGNLAWDEKAVVTTVDVGGRLVHRVTPNPSLTTTATFDRRGARFDFSSGTPLIYPGAIRVTPPRGARSSRGYWVVQYPDRGTTARQAETSASYLR